MEIINLRIPKFPQSAGVIDPSDIGMPASIDVSPDYVVIGVNSNSQLPGHIVIFEVFVKNTAMGT